MCGEIGFWPYGQPNRRGSGCNQPERGQIVRSLYKTNLDTITGQLVTAQQGDDCSNKSAENAGQLGVAIGTAKLD